MKRAMSREEEFRKHIEQTDYFVTQKKTDEIMNIGHKT